MIEFVGTEGNDIISGSKGNDFLEGEGGNDTLIGGAGDDALLGGDGDNLIDGGSGNDELRAEDGNNQVNGGDGNDFIAIGDGNSTIRGGSGNDIYNVGLLSTIVEEFNQGTDTVSTYSYNYTLGNNLENLTLQDPAFAGKPVLLEEVNFNTRGTGNNLNNVINGTFLGNDSLYGLGGNDFLNGNGDNDYLVGGLGKDTLTGGAGADRFLFSSPTEGIDIITDFNKAEGDKINVSKSGFSGGLTSDFLINITSSYTLSSSQFTIGSTATDASDRFIYNSSTGGLFFDIDGTGTQAQVQLATLQTDLSLSSSDIYVYNPMSLKNISIIDRIDISTTPTSIDLG